MSSAKTRSEGVISNKKQYISIVFAASKTKIEATQPP